MRKSVVINPADKVNLSIEHKHQCEYCQTVWKHGNDMLGNELEHSCPRCGKEQWEKMLSSQDQEILLGQALYSLLSGRSSPRQRAIYRQEANSFYDEL